MIRQSPQTVTLLLLLARLLVAVLGKEEIQVVFAGLPRSGTRSVSVALQKLGYKTCHGYDMIPPSGMTEGAQGILQAFAEKRIDDAIRLTEEDGCQATFDIHLWYWREIRKARPNAKFLVVVRDYDRWEASMQTAIKLVKPMMRFPLRLLPVLNLTTNVMLAAAQHSMDIGPDRAVEYFMDGTGEDAIQLRKDMYDRLATDGHKFAKKEPSQALLYSLKDGYAPLCKFLGIADDECPDEEIPRTNSGMELTATIIVFMVLEVAFFAVPILVIYFVTKKWWWKPSADDSATAPQDKKSK